MKHCPDCKKDKVGAKFYISKGRLSTYCKECSRTRSRKYQSTHDDPSKPERRKKARQLVKDKFAEVLNNSQCADCGNDNPVVLVFHHRVPSKKSHGISFMMSNRYSWSAIQKELAKCDCLCCNCHSVRHYEMGDYKKYLRS